MYVPLRLCGFAYKLFEYVFGVEQYFPAGSLPIPSNWLFAQFHGHASRDGKPSSACLFYNNRDIGKN